MSNPVSIIRWRSAEENPPEPDGRFVLAVTDEGDTHRVRASALTREVAEYWGARFYSWWAELPVVGDLTDEDVWAASDHVRLLAGDNVLDGVPGAEALYQLSDRFRAALGGEKE